MEKFFFFWKEIKDFFLLLSMSAGTENHIKSPRRKPEHCLTLA